MSLTIHNYCKNTYSYSTNTKTIWNLMPHKGMKRLNKQDLLEKIEQVAYKRAQLQSNDDFTEVNYQEENLRAQYISLVSPPRKELLQQVKGFLSKYQADFKEPLGNLTLINFLNKDNEVTSATIEPIINSRGGYDYTVSYNGQPVLSSTNGKWLCVMTPLEAQKSHEFNRIFDRAFNKAKQNNSNTITKIGRSIDFKV